MQWQKPCSLSSQFACSLLAVCWTFRRTFCWHFRSKIESEKFDTGLKEQLLSQTATRSPRRTWPQALPRATADGIRGKQRAWWTASDDDWRRECIGCILHEARIKFKCTFHVSCSVSFDSPLLALLETRAIAFEPASAFLGAAGGGGALQH